MAGKQGWSDVTAFKESGFARLLRENLAIAARTGQPSAPYYHFDLTAGDGMNGETPGSPLIWREVADASRTDWRAVFVEIDPGRVERLARRPEMDDPRCSVLCEDHRRFIPQIPAFLEAAGAGRTAVGSVLVDPNGHQHMPLKELAGLARECRRLDFIANWNNMAAMRWLGYYRKRNDPRASEKIRLKDGVALLGKRFWLIRQPVDFWQWTILFGSNYRRRGYERLGFYDIRSQHGISIVDRLSHSKAERNGRVQGVLF
jgi:hypothetical protein